MMGSMLLFTREIQIANNALDVHLSDLETRQEWGQYLKLMPRHHADKKPRFNKIEQELQHYGRPSHYHRH